MCEGENTFLMVQKMIENKVNKAVQGKSCKKTGKTAFILYAGKTIPHACTHSLNSEARMSEVCQKYRAPDGFLYLKYAEMERF